MTNLKAQEHFDQNLTDKSIAKIHIFPLLGSQETLTGNLIIQDYPQLEEIDLKEHELTALIITNCPKLKKINVRNNQLVKLEIQANNEMEEIIANSNNLTDLDLTNCSNLKKLMIADNPDLKSIKGLNFQTIKNFNFANTLFSLEANYQVLKEEITEIKKEKEGLEKALKVYDEAGFQKPLVLTESIQTVKQANEAIKRLLIKKEKEWRAYFESTDPNIAENSPILGAFFQDLEERRKGKKILTWIIEAQTSEDYQELFDKWTNCTEYDYDDSRSELTELLNRKKELTQ